MRRTAPEVPMSDIFMGVLPFVLGELVIIGLVIAFPQIALWLPAQMNCPSARCGGTPGLRRSAVAADPPYSCTGP